MHIMTAEVNPLHLIYDDWLVSVINVVTVNIYGTPQLSSHVQGSQLQSKTIWPVQQKLQHNQQLIMNVLLYPPPRHQPTPPSITCQSTVTTIYQCHDIVDWRKKTRLFLVTDSCLCASGRLIGCSRGGEGGDVERGAG